MQIDTSELARIRWHFKRHHISRSYQRELVFLAFGRLGASSRVKIANYLQNEVSETAVYRIIKVFRKINVLTEAGTNTLRLSDHFIQHHHTIRCTECGQVTRFNNQAFEKLVTKIAADRQFQLQIHN